MRRFLIISLPDELVSLVHPVFVKILLRITYSQ
jgi:hypothetical protein